MLWEPGVRGKALLWGQWGQVPLPRFRRGPNHWGDQLASGGRWCGSGPEDSLPTLLRFKGPVASRGYSQGSEVIVWAHGDQCFRHSDKRPLSPSAHSVPLLPPHTW